MLSENNFKEKHEPKRQLGFFAEEELENLKGKLPDEVIAFLEKEGRCTFGNDFLWTTLPQEHQESLYGWGLEEFDINPDECYVFMRTSLGSLIFVYGEDYYTLNPIEGTYSNLGDGFQVLLNFTLSMDVILEGSFSIHFLPVDRDRLPTLKEDEIYALNPTIPEGGSPETSEIEVANMKEHLGLLSEFYSHKVTED